MIELRNDNLDFSFPKVHEDAKCVINFQRTLRIPDDNREYPLPPGLGTFPVRHVDDYADRLPKVWSQHGGVLIPMYQSEALWINFLSGYPCAVKIAAGKINAVSGEQWSNGLCDEPQDYVVVPKQPWLDGFNIADGHVRQFVAMPLGEGFTAEEQITGQAEHGGLQIIVYPMRRSAYMAYLKKLEEREELCYGSLLSDTFGMGASAGGVDMGLAPGGLMRQEIYDDEHGIDAWDQHNGFRCFVHLANSEMYEAVTQRRPPHRPPSAQDYTRAGLPWFDFYSDGQALPGAESLGKLSSVGASMIAKGKGQLTDNEPVQPKSVKIIAASSPVRDGEF